ncbi:MAG: polysaccharide export outer membrane protein, partial [Gallionellaceae bacterium]
SQQISILGNVLKPGRYPLEQRINLVEALALAGGINPAGADTVTVLARKGGNLARHEIDVDALLRGGDASSSLELAAGDVLYVPRAPMFYVYGEVQRPGAFRLERNMMVVQALATGGGLTMRGTERGLRIKRRNADGMLEIIEAGANDLLRAEDVLVVRESLF